MNTKPTEITVRDRQQTAVAALADLLTRDLPPLRWEVRPYASMEHLQAQPGGDDDTKMRTMRSWALSLGVDIAETTHKDYVNHEIDAEHMGATIRIFTHTSATYSWVQVGTTAQVQA